MFEWDRILQSITNIAVILGGIKVLRHMDRMEWRLDIMWNEFKRKFKIEDRDEL